MKDLKHKLGADVVLVDKNNRVLLTKRSDDNCWCMPGGWVEKYETPDQAAVREVEEETGLTVELIKYADVTVRDSGSVHVTYLAKYISGNLRNSKESSAVAYVAFDEVSDWHADHKTRISKALNLHSKLTT